MGRIFAAIILTVAVVSAPSAVAGGFLGPTTLVAAFGSVWVGMGNGEVVRLDERTGRELARLPGSPTDSVHGLAVADSALWVLRGRLLKVDPRRGTTREVRGMGSATAFNIAVAAGAIWAIDDGANTVTRVDPARARRSTVVRIPGRAFGLAAGRDQVFVVSVPTSGPVTGPSGRRLLRRIDARTNRLSRPLVELECDPGIAIGRDVVWTTDPCSGWLVRRDPETLRPTGKLKVPPWHSPVLGFGSVWLVGGNQLVRIDPKTLRVQASTRVAGGTAAVGKDAIWVLSFGNGIRGTVTRVDPRTNRVVGRPIPIAPK
jgi:hypothetical protein